MLEHMWYCVVFIFMQGNHFHTVGHSYSKQSWSNLSLSCVPPGLAAGLRTLDLSNNLIRHLHELDLPYLEQLDVSSNQLNLISEGFFQNLTRLEKVNLSRNMLNINLYDNGRALQSINTLKILDISLNGLSEDAVQFYLQNKFALCELKLSGNALQRLSNGMFEDSLNLRSIWLDNNVISVIEQRTFESMRKLETLHLAQNNLASICDFKLYHLKYLNLSRNSIEFFVTPQDNFPYRLEILDLSFNKLFYLPIVPKRNRLRHMHLQQNNIGFLISEAEMVTENDALDSYVVSGDHASEKIDYLHYNWRSMPLVYVDLSNNNFQTFPLLTLGFPPNLETLNLSHNCVQNISWTASKKGSELGASQVLYSSLKHLDLQSNGLVHVSTRFLEALVQIETLNLRDNSVQPCPLEDLSLQRRNQHSHMSSCVSFRPLRTLKHLNLRENNIKTLHKSAFESNSLVSLNLGNNPYMVMQNGALEAQQKTLRSLTLSELNISELVLHCMPALTQLNISNNILDHVPSAIGCSPLTELDVRNNKLRSLNQTFIYDLTKHLQIMHISGNPFDCCDSAWLSVLNTSKVTLPDMQSANCQTGDVKIKMEEYAKSPSFFCSDKKTTLLLLIIFAILLILFLAIFIFCKVMCSITPIV